MEYRHDPLGRRVAKLVDGEVMEKYLWMGRTTLLAVYNGDGALKSRFLYADGRTPLGMVQDGETYYFAYDQVGSLRAVTDAEGSVVKTVRYDSFGNIIEDSNPDLTVPFGFAGGLHDMDTGLVRFGYRDYDPDTGRWTAKDPIGFSGGDVNVYGYVVNDTIRLEDPKGLKLWYVDSASDKHLRQHVETLMQSPKGRELLGKLHNADEQYYISDQQCPNPKIKGACADYRKKNSLHTSYISSKY